MRPDQEKEYKVLLTHEQYEKILHSYDFEKPLLQTNTYFDTKDGQLKNKMGAVRIRNLPERNVLTVKLPLDETSKLEYEKDIQADDINHLSLQDRKFITDKAGVSDPLYEIATFTTDRRNFTTAYAVVSLDHTTFGKHEDYELEYEYRKDHDGLKALENILEIAGIKYIKNCPSKLARAIKYSTKS